MSVTIFKIKAFLFDLDGTLVNTTPLVENFWRSLAADHGLDHKKILATSHGRRTIDTLKEWAPHLATEELADSYESALALKTDGLSVIPGTFQLLSRLPQNVWAIGTAGRASMAEARLSQMNIPIPKVLVSGDQVTHGKPDPEIYLTAASRLGFPPEVCIVVEDAPAGIKAGKSAGMKTIGVISTHTKEQLVDAGVDVVIASLEDIEVTLEENDIIKVTCKSS